MTGQDFEPCPLSAFAVAASVIAWMLQGPPPAAQTTEATVVTSRSS